MKVAQMFSVPSAQGFAWKWRATDTRAESAKAFDYYHDCVEDALKNGYSVKGGTEVNGEAGSGERPDLGNFRLR